MKYRDRLLVLDDLIHPASYKGRNVKGEGPLMVITLLHLACRNKALGFDRPILAPPVVKSGSDDYTQELTRQFPQLLPLIEI